MDKEFFCSFVFVRFQVEFVKKAFYGRHSFSAQQNVQKNIHFDEKRKEEAESN